MAPSHVIGFILDGFVDNEVEAGGGVVSLATESRKNLLQSAINSKEEQSKKKAKKEKRLHEYVSTYQGNSEETR